MTRKHETSADGDETEKVSLRIHPALAARLRKERVRRFTDARRGNVSLNSLIVEFVELALDLLDAADTTPVGCRTKASVGAIARAYTQKQREAV